MRGLGPKSRLISNPTVSAGHNNTAIGITALYNANGGSGNIALGVNAGLNVTNGSNNIHIGSAGAAESGIIRIGIPGTHQGALIAGISNSNVGSGSTVFVNGNGQLGTILSSGRFKEDVAAVGDDSRRLLALRAVRFHYKPAYDDPSRPLQYGLVAEEVAEVFPELVHPDGDGTPYSVRYHLLSVLLLNELQRQERQLEAQDRARQDEKAQTEARLAAQQRELDELRAQVRALVGGKAAVRE
jgi:hypothetical protein